MNQRGIIPGVGIKPDPIVEGFQSLLVNIVSDDSPIENQLGHILNTIYTQHRPELFTKYLDRYIGKKEREIEKICSSHSQQFIKSLNILLELQKDAIVLRDRVSSFGNELQRTAREALSNRLEKIQYSKLHVNLKNTLDAFESCHALFEKVNIIQIELNHIHDKNKKCNYHTALKGLVLLQEYQHESERHVLIRLQPWINHAYKSIEQSILSDIRDWLTIARQVSSKLGQLILQEMEKRFFCENFTEKDLIDGIELPDLFTQVNLDCEVIFRTIYMFRLMKREKVFVSYYAENRKFQAEIMLQGTSTMLQRSFSYLGDYICEILGFFVIEFFMMSSPYEFYPSSQVFVLWEKAQDNLQNIFAGDETEQQKDASETSKNVTTLMIQFLRAIDYFNFPSSRLVEVLSVMFHKNMESIKIFIMENIHQRILEDTCANLAVANSEEEFTKVKEKLSFISSLVHRHDTENQIFPIKLPFTPLILNIFDDLISLTDAIFDFAITNRELNASEYASKSLDTCITQHIVQLLVNLRISRQISYYVHVWLDLQALIHIVDILEGYLVDKQSHSQFRRLTHSSSQTNLRYQTYSTNHLKSKQTIPRFQVVVRQKISALLWEELSECLSVSLNDEFSGTIKDPIDLMTSIWNLTLDPLPFNEKSNIIGEALNVLSSAILDKMLDQEIITDKMVQSLQLHVKMIQKFIKNIEWKGNNLSDIMILSQIAELLHTNNPEKYLDNEYRLQHYSSLSTGIVIVVLEKIKTGSDKSDLIQELILRLQLEENDNEELDTIK